MKQKEIEFVLKKMQEEINLRKEFSVDSFAFIYHSDYESYELLPSEYSFDKYQIIFQENGFLIWEILDDNEGVEDKDVKPAWNLTFHYVEYDMIKGITNVF